jgi:hypothetical protein
VAQGQRYHHFPITIRSLTPKRVACDGEESRNALRRSIGFHTASPKMTVDEELTMLPMKLTREKPRGIAISCGQTAAPGCEARDAKSGAFLARKIND